MDKGIKEILQSVLWGLGIVLFVVVLWVVVAIVDGRMDDGSPFDLSPLLSLILGAE